MNEIHTHNTDARSSKEVLENLQESEEKVTTRFKETWADPGTTETQETRACSVRLTPNKASTFTRRTIPKHEKKLIVFNVNLNSGGIPIEPKLMGYFFIPRGWKKYIFHRGLSWNYQSIFGHGLILGGKQGPDTKKPEICSAQCRDNHEHNWGIQLQEYLVWLTLRKHGNHTAHLRLPVVFNILVELTIMVFKLARKTPKRSEKDDQWSDLA